MFISYLVSLELIGSSGDRTLSRTRRAWAFPTVRYLAELLVAQQLMVYSMDFSGHGQDLGLQGFLSSSEVLLQEGMHLVKYAQQHSPRMPLFFAGTSMGGAVALLLSLEIKAGAGLVLLAPMA